MIAKPSLVSRVKGQADTERFHNLSDILSITCAGPVQAIYIQ